MSEPVKLRYLDTSSEMVAQTLLVDADQNRQLKAKALAKLGIHLADDEKPFHAWLKAMHEENGLEFSLPAHQAIVDAMNSASWRWVFWLA